MAIQTLKEIRYNILETISGYKIIDDTNFDGREIDDFIHSSRAEFASQQVSKDPFNIHKNFTQEEIITMAIADSSSVSTYDSNRIVLRSSSAVPRVISSSNGIPAISYIGTAANEPLWYQYKEFNSLTKVGNGRFDSKAVFASIGSDGYLYLVSKSNPYFKGITKIKLIAIFENPSEITGFTEDNEYPLPRRYRIPLEKRILREKFNVILPTDETNDSNYETSQERQE